MSASPVEVAQEFVRAINRQDAEGLAELMTPDHRFTDSLGHVAKGRDGMREGWKLYFQMIPDYHVDVEETLSQGSAVVMIGTAKGTYNKGVQDLEAMGLPNLMKDSGSHAPQEWQTPIAVRALIEDGMVAEWRVFADNEPLRRLMREPV